MAIDLTKFVLRFVEEARDHLARMGDGIALLEQGTADPELINALFRSAHTIKGSSRMVKLTTITETAHRLEDLLGAMREGTLQFSAELAQALYRGIDAIAQLVDRAAEQPANPDLPPVDEELCRVLTTVLQPVASAEAAEAASVPVASVRQEPVKSVDAPEPGSSLPAAEPKLRAADTVRVRLSKLDELIKLMGEVVSSHARMRQRLQDLQGLERAIAGSTSHEQCQGPLHRFSRALKDDVQAQNLLMDELHDKALLMRMLPLSVVFDSAGRTVRELARSLGKQAECVVSGAEIELDRQMIDQLSDPIIHLLRNAIDHGLESPEKRVQAGKTPAGHISLSARQDGGWVLIEISDDGAGIDLATVKEKAVRKGIVSEEAAGSLSQEDIIDLIFLPGFSTSAIITDMSGRGVGMDVVKRSIVDDLQGMVSVVTRPGHGSTFSLRLPLSLAVMRVLLVEVQGLPFGFTSQYVAGLVRVPGESVMVVAAGRNAVVLDNEFVPVVPLSALVKVPPHLAGPARPGHLGITSGLLLVVLQVRNEKLALIVDELLDEYDMVIKPLPEHLRHLPMVSGMVITGKNELVNVLHAPALLDASRKLQRTTVATERGVTGKEVSSGGFRVLVVDDSLSTREIEKDLLEAYGYQITLAEDGQDGLNKALTEPFDAVLTDVEMPNMDGFTLTARLREDERYRTIPIIIITSREREEDKRRGIQVGADAYIVKSDFEQSSLVDTLRALLG